MNEVDDLDSAKKAVSKMMLKVIHHENECDHYFFNHLNVIMKCVDSELSHLTLFAFIHEWCDLGNFSTTRILVDHFPEILPKNSSRSILDGFLPILRDIIARCGLAILPELLNFLDAYKEICGKKFIRKSVFPYLECLMNSELHDVAACTLVFFTHLISEIGQENAEKLIQIANKLIESKYPCTRLRVVFCFSRLVKYINDEEKKKEFFDRIIIGSLRDTNIRIRARAIKIAAKHHEMISDMSIFIALSNDQSWKIKFCLLSNMKHFLKASPEFEKILLFFARNNTPPLELRGAAFYQINKLFKKLNQTNEILRCVDLAIKSKDEPLIISALPLIPKLIKKDSTIINSLSSLVARFKDTRKEAIQLSILRNAIPFIDLKENEKIIAIRWMKGGLDSLDWRNNDAALDAIEAIIESSHVDILNEEIFDKVFQKISDNSFSIRNRASMLILTYIIKFGWDYTKEKIMPMLRDLINNCTFGIHHSLVRLYVGMKCISPPPDIEDEVNEFLAKMGQDKVYIPTLITQNQE